MTFRDTEREGGALATLARTVAAVPPGAGAVVMGTGIVSIDLTLNGEEPLSLVTLAVASIAWVILGILLVDRLLWARASFDHEASVPAGLTGVAGTAVLATRLTLLGWRWAGAVIIVVAAALWFALVGRVLRRWVTPAVGASFMLTVSTESLAILLAELGLTSGAGWLILLSVVALALGVGFYGFVIRRFDLRQLLVGRGDHWVAGGALAISALACALVTQAGVALHLLGGGAALRAATLVLWAAAVAWLPFLVVTELVSRRVFYDTRRWSTVFPVGMYAACSFVAGTALGLSALTKFARIWTWFALAVWVVVLAATLWQPVALWRAGGRPSAGAVRDETEHA